MAFTVDVTDLRAHARHIDWLTDRLTNAADAAAVRQLTQDTYGLLSQPLIPILHSLQDAGQDAIAAGSSSMTHVGTAMRCTADDYEDVETDNRSRVIKSREQHEEPPEKPGPLVSTPEHRTVQAVVFTKIDGGHWYEGIDLFEGIGDIVNGVTSGDWSEVGVGAVSTVIEGVNVGIDPLSTLTKYAAGWLLEHGG